MKIVDFNRSDFWSVEAVQRRYLQYAAKHLLPHARNLQPKEHVHGDTRWIYPIMYAVIDGLNDGDLACAEIAVEFIECDMKFPFGANLKSRAARALIKKDLPEALRNRIRNRVADMLIDGNTPREFREYARLLRKVGFSKVWSRLAAAQPKYNKYSIRYFLYFLAVHQKHPSAVPSNRMD